MLLDYSFLWFYAFNVFFKSLPHGFVHFFLASYAPEEHSFIAKMVPFSIGTLITLLFQSKLVSLTD